MPLQCNFRNAITRKAVLKVGISPTFMASQLIASRKKLFRSISCNCIRKWCFCTGY